MTANLCNLTSTLFESFISITIVKKFSNPSIFARGVTDAINQLLSDTMTTAPGQKECDSAIRNIEGMSYVLENPVEPVNEASFFECLDTATEKSQQLAQSMQDITAALKKEDTDNLANSASVASDAVCQLTESTAQVKEI